MNNRMFLTILAVCIFLISSVCEGSDFGSTANTGLIDIPQLKDDTAKWVILDARPLKYWEKSHIPKSISFCWENYTKTDENQIAYRILPPVQIAQAFGKLGISDKTNIVVYGDADESWGGEGWLCWVFAWLGHKGDIRLLKGGIQAWEKGGYPLISEKDIQAKNLQTKDNQDRDNKIIQPVEYKLNLTYASSQSSLKTSSVNIYAKEIHDNLDKYQLVDTRSTIEWFKGHLPNAVHIPWEKFFKGRDRSPLNAEELKSLLNKNGLNMEKTVVYYCTGGIRSGYAWMVHQLAAMELKEIPKAINFEGGTEEWEKVIEK